ncbi:MAG TPA: glutamate--tRNA ligase family protein [Candidatus Paceibacterota bacterium]|nr:glutamate--tRNA ligase family protein [Candidatus Paceibacterota bacterium]
MTVKVRMAPSPTGNLHIGTARTALFNWLYARKTGGQFIMRIEDTDLERSKPEFEADIIDGFEWLGIDWDNEHLYRQTERTDLYRAKLRQLLDEGKAFEKHYSSEEKAAMVREGRNPRDSIIVLKEPDEGTIGFDDTIRGHIEVDARRDVGLVSLAKDLDTPLYNFAVVVDDIDMAITDVIRGEDHISNTPKQLLIYRALGAPPPRFAHLPLILGPDRSKLSKRHGATSVSEYRKDYLPEAMVDFMAHLGHTYPQDIMTRDELIAGFDLAKVHKSGAIFDRAKLEWTNAQYLKMMPSNSFKELIGHPELPDEAVPLMTERLERLSDVGNFSYLWKDPSYDASLLTWKNDEPSRTLKALSDVALLADRAALTQDDLDLLAADHFDGQKGSVYWPLRIALSGLKNSAGPVEIASIIGPERTRERITSAITKLRT